jgi:MFS family permease
MLTNMSSSIPPTATQAPAHGNTLLTREFLILAAATTLYFLGMGASNPLLPKFVVDELGGTEATAGVVMGSFAVAALITRSSFGRLGDRRGARRLVLIGCALSATGMLMLVVTETVAMAIGSRLVLGAAQAAVMTGSTTLAIDLAPEARRGEAASYILVAFHLGLGLGPVLGELVRDQGSYDATWLTLAGTAAAGGAVASLLPHRPANPDAPPSPWIHPSGIAPGVVAAFSIVAFVAFSTFVPLYAGEIGLRRVGVVFTVASISIAVARVALGRVPDRLGPMRAAKLSITLTIVGAIILTTWASPTGVFVAAAVLAGGMSMQAPSLIPVAVHNVPPHERASALATFTMFMDASVALTGPLIGLLVSGAGYRVAFSATVVTSVVALVLVSTQLAPRWERRPMQAQVSSASS